MRQVTATQPPQPRILWDMTFAARSLTGTRVYTQKLFETLTRLSDWNFIQVGGITENGTRPRGNLQGNAQNILWLFRNAEREANRLKPDLYHSAAYLGPWRLPCPGVLNVFDTSYLAYPQYFDWKWKFYARTVIPRAVRSASAVLTLSEHARGEILKAYDVSPDKVHIVAPGVSPEFHSDWDAAVLAQLRAKYGLAENYVLYVGGRDPRKNVPALIKAFEIVRREIPELQFVIAGPRDNQSGTASLVQTSDTAPALRELDFVPQADLPALYAGARAFFYASMLEGFGMPPVEAMACGTPVVTAPNPPMPQVLGDSALYTVDDSPEALAQGVLHLLRDNTLARELQSRGLARAKMYTWETAARKTLEIYGEVLARSGR